MIYIKKSLLFIYFYCFYCQINASRKLIGGFHNIDDPSSNINNNIQLNKAVSNIFQELNQNNNDLFNSFTILKASEQLVNGMNYRVTLRLDGKDSDANDIEIICDAKIYYMTWGPDEGKSTLNSYNCTNVFISVAGNRRKRSYSGGRVGGHVVEWVDDNDSVDKIPGLHFALDQLNRNSNNFYKAFLHRILQVDSQIVAGIDYRVEAELKIRSCNEGRLSECVDANVVDEIMVCTLNIWVRLWLEEKYVFHGHSCRQSDKNNSTIYFSADDSAVKRQFEDFKAKFNKKYLSKEEETKRLKIFTSNMEIAKFAQKHDRGTAVYGPTIFADLSSEEFRKNFLGPIWDKNSQNRMKPAKIPKISLDDVPKSFDWRDLKAVSPVKNQGYCGSCWAFSVTGNIEGQWAIKKKSLISLSEQELVDCDKLDEGCNGGLPAFAYEEIQRLGGLESETDYPYEGKDETCNLNKQDIKVYINGSVNISSNEAEMAVWLYKNGPMSIGINSFAMQFYLGGISHPWHILCPLAADHGVLIVGYAVKKGFFRDTPYWIVKNSWGENWGEKGYYLVYRGDGTCGLNLMVSSAVVA